MNYVKIKSACALKRFSRLYEKTQEWLRYFGSIYLSNIEIPTNKQYTIILRYR